MVKNINLDQLRKRLILLEETIIFALLKRSLFKQNLGVYQPAAIKIPDFNHSFLDFILLGTEKTHAKAGRFKNPDEYSFFPNLPSAILEPSPLRQIQWLKLKKDKINSNQKIKGIYIDKIIPLICEAGTDYEFGSAAVTDVDALFALSQRIHFGIFIAESKFNANEDQYTRLIKNRQRDDLLKKLTHRKTEEEILNRVERKARFYGQDLIESSQKGHGIDPGKIKTIYKHWIIPLTKGVEVKYLFNRLNLNP